MYYPKNTPQAASQFAHGLMAPQLNRNEKNDELQIWWHLWPLSVDRGCLGDYQYFSKPCFKREETDLDCRGDIVARVGLNTLVFHWAA